MIKSFEVDHTKLKAPCIRLADVYEKNGVVVKKYDLRFVTPNTEMLHGSVIHSMEHLLATAFKKVFADEMIDLSPMGCRTGFYFTCFETEQEVFKIVEALNLSPTIEVPKPTEKNCGSYVYHNFEVARYILGKTVKNFKIEITKESK